MDHALVQACLIPTLLHWQIAFQTKKCKGGCGQSLPSKSKKLNIFSPAY